MLAASLPRFLFTFAWMSLLAGCATYVAPQAPRAEFAARAESRTDGDVSVSAAALTPAESEDWFAAPLAAKGIQPVWLEVRNGGRDALLLNLLAVDDDYFSPSEAAWRSRRGGEGGMTGKQIYFNEQHIALIVEPGETASGFVYTRLDPAFKPVTIELVGERTAHRFEMVLDVPGFVADFDRIDLGALYRPGEVRDLDEAGLRAYLEGLPCCTSMTGGQTPAGPVNLALVGDGARLLAALVRRGWEVTGARDEALDAAGGGHGTTPVPPRWLFGRPQDVAMHKSRPSGGERNQLRLWRAPATFAGQPVWVGQVARSTGTDRLEPVVDEARTYVLLDLYNGREVGRLAYVGGAGRATFAEPVRGGDGHFITDGLRAVLLVPGGRYDLDEIEWFEWSEVPARQSELLAPDGPGS